MTITIGRDYRTSTQYEYVLYQGEQIVAREGFFANYSAAKRAGLKKAREIENRNA